MGDSFKVNLSSEVRSVKSGNTFLSKDKLQAMNKTFSVESRVASHAGKDAASQAASQVKSVPTIAARSEVKSVATRLS